MKLKILSLLAALFLVFFSTQALAIDPGYEILRVEANGIIAQQQTGDAIFVERDSRLPIKVFLRGTDHADNLRIRAWIGGYEYGLIEDETNVFSIEPGVLYQKILVLDIPEDIGASDDYTLHVETFDDDVSTENEYLVRVKEKRHELNILDVLIRPNIVEAGRPVLVEVRLENLGQKKEEDIKVIAQVEPLGVSSATFIDELVPYEIPDEDEETSASTDDILLFLPREALSGIYPLDIIIEYDRGYEVLIETFNIKIEGSEEIREESSLIKIQPKSRTIAKEGTAQFRVMIANLGDTSKNYEILVEGANLFSTSRVSPLITTIAPDETRQQIITLNTRDLTGDFNFIVKILEDGKIIKEETLYLEVVDADVNFSVFIALIILIALVLLLILFVAVKSYSRL